MGHIIAVSGKGGVGKTTLCGLLIQYLCDTGKGPVLAVDADANANLNEVLGVEVLGVLASGVLVLGVLVSPPPQDTRAMHMARARTRAEIFFIYKSSFFSCSCVYFVSPAPREGRRGETTK